MDYLPICLKLQDHPALLVGGGRVGGRKARLLLRAGARLTVVAPGLGEELAALAGSGAIDWIQTGYDSAHLQGATLVVAATPDRALNHRVYQDATAAGIPVNVVDDPDLCSFIFPSIVDRNPVIVAITSSGRSPVLARQLRRRIEAMTPAAYGRLADFAGRLRDRVRSVLSNESSRRLFWEQVVDGRVGELVLAGNERRAEEELERQLQGSDVLDQGEVYLVGAGPGDPDLLTFKAMRLLQTADVVLYDRLVAPEILDKARRDAERIYVGKRRAEHSLPQEEINQLLLRLAQEGKRVVRLKGGDPFIFGRGGEEIELLARHRVPFQVVPGITAASGAACYAGIPLTHRDHAHSVRFVTGHLRDDTLDLDWDQFTDPRETLVFYMGLMGLPSICRQLQAHGRDPGTPVALVERATTSSQRVLTGTLATMESVVEREQPRAPTLIIVGAVVGLHRSLSWFGEDSAR